MKLKDIYQKYSIPERLQQHMLRVYSVTNFIASHWQSAEKVDFSQINKTALVHDLGNIVIFDPKAQEKYGFDDHVATQTILQEIKVKPDMVQLSQSIFFTDSINILKDGTWPIKILYYADFRVMPDRISSLMERLNDIHTRKPKYAAMTNFSELVSAAQTIESQIQSHLNVSLSLISDSLYPTNTNSLLDLDI